MLAKIVGRRSLRRRGGLLFISLVPLQLTSHKATCLPMTSNAGDREGRHRPDGVRITHDPYAPGMAEKYGKPGMTDDEGFDPYADSVGPGIYGGIVRRHPPGHPHAGDVVVGRQYQDHNPNPGPVYAGGGYAPSTLMLEDDNLLS